MAINEGMVLRTNNSRDYTDSDYGEVYLETARGTEIRRFNSLESAKRWLAYPKSLLRSRLIAEGLDEARERDDPRELLWWEDASRQHGTRAWCEEHQHRGVVVLNTGDGRDDSRRRFLEMWLGVAAVSPEQAAADPRGFVGTEQWPEDVRAEVTLASRCWSRWDAEPHGPEDWAAIEAEIARRRGRDTAI